MKHKRILLAILSLALVLVLTLSSVGNVAPTQVMAKESDEIREQLDEVKAERADIQSSMQALNKDIDNNKSEIEKMAAEKAIIDQEIGLMSQDILLINQEIATYGLLIADKQDELDAAQKKLDELTAKKDAKGNLAAIYLKGQFGGFAVHLVQKQ
jgi:Skp family chaperone for outer membrane proteins